MTNTFQLTIEMENAAFDDFAEMEVARILRKVSSDLHETGDFDFIPNNLKDINGNTVGAISIYLDE